MIRYNNRRLLCFLLILTSLMLISVNYVIPNKLKTNLEQKVSKSKLTQYGYHSTIKTKAQHGFHCYNSSGANILKDFYRLDCENPFLKYISLLNVTSTSDVCELFNDSLNSYGNYTFYSRIKEDFKYFTKPIDRNDIANMSWACPFCHHIQIIDGQLYVVPREKAWNTQTRSRSAKTLFKQVVDTFKPVIGDLELFYYVGDIVELASPELNKLKHNVPVLGISKNYRQPHRGLHPSNIVFYPCFTFWAWPEPRVGRWRTKLESIPKAADRIKFNDRIPKVMWRGAQVGDRWWLTGLGNKLKKDSTLDIEFISWKENNRQLALDYTENYKTLEQHCEYKYLLHQEGFFYSSRLKYLLLCGSVVIFANFDGWEEYWYHLLKHDHNVLMFIDKGNETIFKNLIQAIIKDNEKALFIGRNGRALVQKYLNEQAVLCYLRNVIIEYSKIFSYKPEKHPDAIMIDDVLLGYSN